MGEARPVIGLDLDGTLISCREKQIHALQKAMEAIGAEYSDFDTFWRLKRNGSTTIDALHKTGVDGAISEIVAKRWIENVETWECLQRDRIFAGVVESLTIASQRADLLLLSARRSAEMFERQVNALGLSAYLTFCEVVFASADVVNAKAACLIKYRARCYIGDTESDMAAASGANIPAYLVSTGQRSEEFLRRVLIGNENTKVFNRFDSAIDQAVNYLDKTATELF